MLKCGKFDYFLTHLVCTVLLSVSVLPGFALIGNIFLQVFVTVIITGVIVLFTDLIFKPEPIVYANSQNATICFWTIYAVVEQVVFHIEKGAFTFRWYQLFYYDRPALIFIVYFVCILYFIVKLLIRKNDKDYIEKYSVFIRSATLGLIVFYFLILVYSFFLIRTITFEKPEVNLIPFKMIVFTFSRGYIDYELLFLFLGNIMIFLPLGILISAFYKNKPFLLLFPVILSFTIELSQFILGNGHPDIDDLILNVIGFYIGIVIRKLIDAAVKRTTGGALTSFFAFKK